MARFDVFAHESSFLAPTSCAQIGKIAEVLKYLRPAVGDAAWDEIILALITVLREELGDLKLADQYTQVLKSDGTKIEALIGCGRLKAAYLAAVNSKLTNTTQFVQRIRAAAGSTVEGSSLVITSLCDSYLKEHE